MVHLHAPVVGGGLPLVNMYHIYGVHLFLLAFVVMFVRTKPENCSCTNLLLIVPLFGAWICRCLAWFWYERKCCITQSLIRRNLPLVFLYGTFLWMAAWSMMPVEQAETLGWCGSIHPCCSCAQTHSMIVTYLLFLWFTSHIPLWYRCLVWMCPRYHPQNHQVHVHVHTHPNQSSLQINMIVVESKQTNEGNVSGRASFASDESLHRSACSSQSSKVTVPLTPSSIHPNTFTYQEDE